MYLKKKKKKIIKKVWRSALANHVLCWLVGDTVECRLTTTPPQKAISIRILCGSGVPLAKNKPGSPGFPIAYEEDRKASQLSYNGNSSEGDTCSVHSVVESCLSLTDDGLEDEMEYSLGLSWVDNLLCWNLKKRKEKKKKKLNLITLQNQQQKKR